MEATPREKILKTLNAKSQTMISTMILSPSRKGNVLWKSSKMIIHKETKYVITPENISTLCYDLFLSSGSKTTRDCLGRNRWCGLLRGTARAVLVFVLLRKQVRGRVWCWWMWLKQKHAMNSHVINLEEVL